MDIITTSLAQIKAHDPCADGYRKLVKSLGGLKYGMKTPITFKQIYDSNGYGDTIWCLATAGAKFYPLWRHFAVDCAQRFEHLMKDERSLNALIAARLYADGKTTSDEFSAAAADAFDVACAAADAFDVASASAHYDDAAAAAAFDAYAVYIAASVSYYASDSNASAVYDVCDTSVSYYAGSTAATKNAQIKLLLEYTRLGARPKDSAELLKRFIAEAAS